MNRALSCIPAEWPRAPGQFYLLDVSDVPPCLGVPISQRAQSCRGFVMSDLPREDVRMYWDRLTANATVSSAEKLMLYTLTQYADWKTGGNIYASVTTMALDSGYSERWVGVLLSRLAKRGIVVFERDSLGGQTKNGRGITHLLRLDAHLLSHLGRDQKAEQAVFTAKCPKPPKENPELRAPLSDERSLEPRTPCAKPRTLCIEPRTPCATTPNSVRENPEESSDYHSVHHPEQHSEKRHSLTTGEGAIAKAQVPSSPPPHATTRDTPWMTAMRCEATRLLIGIAINPAQAEATAKGQNTLGMWNVVEEAFRAKKKANERLGFIWERLGTGAVVPSIQFQSVTDLSSDAWQLRRALNLSALQQYQTNRRSPNVFKGEQARIRRMWSTWSEVGCARVIEDELLFGTWTDPDSMWLRIVLAADTHWEAWSARSNKPP